MKRLTILAAVSLIALAIAAFAFSEHMLAMGLAVSSMALFLLPTATRAGNFGTGQVGTGQPLASRDRSKADIQRIREYRERHPHVSLIDAVRVVEGGKAVSE